MLSRCDVGNEKRCGYDTYHAKGLQHEYVRFEDDSALKVLIAVGKHVFKNIKLHITFLSISFESVYIDHAM